MNKSLYKTAFHLIRNYYGTLATENEILAVCNKYNLDYDDTVDASRRECRNAFYNIARVSQKGMKMTPTAYESFLQHGLEFITKDHPIGRTTSALQAFKKIESGEFNLDNIEHFVAWIETQCQTIYTTKEENQKLKRFQTEEYKDLSNEERYHLAGLINKPCISCFIEKPDMRKIKKKPHKYIYIIHGIVYTRDEACEKFNITPTRLTNNCVGPDKRGNYTEWQRKENR